MLSETVEFTISQYADGSLLPAERAEVERLLQSDEAARALLAEYQQLNATLDAHLPPLPAVQWENLADHLSAAIDEAEAARHSRAYRLPAWTQHFAPRLALAASLLVASGVGIAVYFHGGAGSSTITTTPKIAQVTAPTSHDPVVAIARPATPGIVVFKTSGEASASAAAIDVRIGPGAAVRDEPIVVRYNDDLISRPSRLAVASGVTPTSEAETFAPDMQ